MLCMKDWDVVYGSDEEEEAGDFIGVEQAKELVTDIIQRMDIMDMVHFDRWLKTMTIARDSFSGWLGIWFGLVSCLFVSH